MAYLTDGHPTRVTFYALGTGVTLLFKEKELTPPGLDGGGENDTTTFRNNQWRTKQPKKLLTLTNGSVVGQYDPAIYDQILQIINVNGVIAVYYPDGSYLVFYGWLGSFTPATHVEGQMPTATCNIFCSNQDENGDEVGPDYQAAAA